MKILVVCQHYYPEPFRLTDICEALVQEGHEVTVITGTPNYPMGKIYPGYEKGKKKDEILNGVKIHRCFEIGRRSGILFRFLNYYSFAISSKRYAKKLKEEFDVVFANQLSPIMMSAGAVAYKKKHKKKLVLYCMDLWPESLAAGGVKKGSFLYKHYHKVSKKIYTQADKLLITSAGFREYLKTEFNIEDERIEYVPQYAEDLFAAELCKKEPNETVDLLFAGNVGVAQSIQTLLETAKRTRDLSDLRWHIVGEGSELEHCKAMVESENLTDCIFFYGRKPVEEMPEYYKKADGMLVSLMNDSVVKGTLPGKVQTYMAAGKPILGATGGETQRIIEAAGCGYCGEAEDMSALEENVRKFYADCKNGKSAELGENALEYYKQHFTKRQFMDTLIENFTEVQA
ncbi:MAG: glycosyltransferase family 4 protein [Clostridia bacterium]|nr:glycosyltransferase family 4 protein [Clostridia bacterium]